MQNNAIIKSEGMKILVEQLGLVNAERFITLVKRDSVDYTEWQRNLYKDVPLDKFLDDAMAFREERK